MTNLVLPESTLERAKLIVKIADTLEEIESAFRLRYHVFVEEENNPNLQNESRLEQDEYDLFCDHIIVKNQETNEVVGTYRIMLHQQALRGKGFYSETEFDLSGFHAFRPYSMELGRSCVHPDYRQGVVIQMLWREIGQYVNRHHVQYLIGCASAYHLDSLKLRQIYTLLHNKKMITDRYGVKPLPSHRIDDLHRLQEPMNEKEILRQCPPLLKGYMWLGAEIGGEPAYDPIFTTTDFFIVLETTKIAKRYKSFFA